jgi:hypothetical protein
MTFLFLLHIIALMYVGEITHLGLHNSCLFKGLRLLLSTVSGINFGVSTCRIAILPIC